MVGGVGVGLGPVAEHTIVLKIRNGCYFGEGVTACEERFGVRDRRES